jgi:transposase
MGKRISYSRAIKESTEELIKIEKRQSSSLLRDRVRFIRLLKSERASTQKEASAQLGISQRQGQRNWRLYKEQGVKGLVKPPQRGGGQTKLKESEFEELKKDLLEKEVQFLHEAVSHVKDKYKQDYTIPGMHFVFKRLEIKKKTGRPVNVKQDKDQLEQFKKTSNR